jgi:hypothetical protein
MATAGRPLSVFFLHFVQGLAGGGLLGVALAGLSKFMVSIS